MTTLICKLEAVADEVKEDLQYSPLVAKDLLQDVGLVRTYVDLQVNLLLLGLKLYDLECLSDDLYQVEELVVQDKGGVVQLGQVEKVVDEVCDLESRED